MRKLLSLVLLFASLTSFAAERDSLYLYGRIKAAITKIDLTEARVLWPAASGDRVDTITCKGKRWQSGEMVDASDFYKSVPRVDSTYVFDVECEGFSPQTISFTVNKLGKRESYREIPIIYLERAPHQLKEVTVTASKIKFYNKGDTLVFNADAFQLAEGSMLDGLISQLPGVELNDNGQIKVNGEFVESLLLNGKEFFDGDNQLMLDNIAAYTVKNVEVYRGQNHKEKWTGDESGKHLTMDVKLKKEYNMGWLINAQGGVGTEDRYSGRLFARWFTATHSLNILGNVNNLNDNRRPGKADTWTPDKMPDGTRRYQLAATQYTYADPEETVEVEANVKYENLRTNDITTTSRTNFLGSTNTYDHSFSRAHSSDTRLNSGANIWLRNSKQQYFYLNLTANYRHKVTDGSALSATFDREQDDIDREIIETLYTEANPERLAAVINRAETRTDGSMRSLDLRATPGLGFSLASGDRLSFETYFRYNRQKEERWNDYRVNYGADPVPAVRRRQYFDDSPNHIMTSVNNLTYRIRTGDFFFNFNYEYRFSDHEKDSYMYALERLQDMGMFGVLPAGYLDAFDPANSYTSRLIENKHSFEPRITYTLQKSKKYDFDFVTNPSLSLKHQRLDYWRDGRSQLVKQTNFIVTSGAWRTFADFRWGYAEEDRRRGYNHFLTYHFDCVPTTPDPFDRLDVINDADPLNITVGNADLKTAYNFHHRLSYFYEPVLAAHPLSEEVTMQYDYTNNALTRGYVYDTTTGVRTTRTYNVDGNSIATLSNRLRLQFGRKNQFSLSSGTEGTIQRYADMIGINMEAAQKSTVSTTTLDQKLDFTWQIGKQSLTARGQVTARRSTSTRDDFSTINARHYSYGLIGDFRLPCGIGIATDFTVYTRRGYGMAQVDRTDAIWNARLSWNPSFARRWVFMLDGFDMLHQLSNVNYAVDAAGRTVSYSNALPRYVMLSVQYRLNIQPKKK